jgi:hypothetical protein
MTSWSSEFGTTISLAPTATKNLTSKFCAIEKTGLQLARAGVLPKKQSFLLHWFA